MEFQYISDTFTINQESNEQDFFRRLHAFIITEACNRLKDILGILDIECLNLTSEKIESFGSMEFIVYRLNQELSNQFITHKQNILKLMKRYIEEDSSIKLFQIQYLLWGQIASI